MKTITLEDFIKQGRDAALAALDAYVREKTGHEWACGWRDKDLQKLAPALDEHLRTVAERIMNPNSNEPGSMDINITGMNP